MRRSCGRATRRRRGARALIGRLCGLLRCAFPRARLRVRLDGGFATPALLDRLDAERVEYVVAMAENAVLAQHAAPAMVDAHAARGAHGGTEHVYTEAHYAARSWTSERRIVIKAEVVRLAGREPRDNPRFVITNLRQTPRWVYERVYCARGEIENRIKELHDGLQIGRTSCSRFWANQLRVLLTAAAYVLLQELRLRAARTAYARAQVTTLRERLLKIGVHVVAVRAASSCISPRRSPMALRGTRSPGASASLFNRSLAEGLIVHGRAPRRASCRRRRVATASGRLPSSSGCPIRDAPVHVMPTTGRDGLDRFASEPVSRA